MKRIYSKMCLQVSDISLETPHVALWLSPPLIASCAAVTRGADSIEEAKTYPSIKALYQALRVDIPQQ